MAMPSLYRPRISPISLAVSPWAICVVFDSMNSACPPSWAMPDSNEPLVRVEEKKNSMASVLSLSNGCGMPRARCRLRSNPTSRSVSISSFVHSSNVMRSRPRRLVCMARLPLLDRAEDQRQQRHPHHHAVERLDPVPLVSRLVDVGGQLVHARERMQHDRAALGLLQQLPRHLVLLRRETLLARSF